MSDSPGFKPLPKAPSDKTALLMKTVEEAAVKRAEMVETYVVAYLKAHPSVTMDDLVLVEQTIGNRIVWYFSTKNEVRGKPVTDVNELLGPGNPNNETRKQMEREADEAIKNLATRLQPTPKATESPDCWLLVMEDMKDRREFGLAKYGVPVRHDSGRDPLADAYQEVLDLAVYLRAEIQRRRDVREEELERCIRVISEGHFLHDQAPAAQFAREVIAALKRGQPEKPVPTV